MNEVNERIAAIEKRLATHATAGFEPGLTEPDPVSEERWEAALVWAHMAEFVDYWREQAERVIRQYDGEPVEFGRVKTDAGRMEAIESGRRQSIGDLAERTRRGLADLHAFIDGLSEQERAAVGRHVTRGDMSIDRLVDLFLLDHLEEHLDQLDGLGQANPQ
jgi:hypothetical protein